jgi:hypothetical protein
LDGKEKRVKLCMKCLKRIKKDMADGKKPFITLVNPPSATLHQIPDTMVSPALTISG